MCYAIPGKLIKIENNVATIDYYGEKKRALIGFTNAKEGDYVCAQGGILVTRIPEKEALETLDAWEELFFELKKIDKNLADKRRDIKSVPGEFLRIMEKANRRLELTRDELKLILGTRDKDELNLLFNTANSIRQREHDNSSCVHGIIEFSNYCDRNCLYCGIRNSRDIDRYRMSEEEIVSAADYAVKKLNFKALVLQSGEDPWYSDEKLAAIVTRIKEMGVLIFLSIGERDQRTYKRLFDAGARAVLLRFETSNEKLFEKLRPARKLEDRLGLIRYLKELGFLVATGFLAGLPGEISDDVINNIILTKELGADMYSFGAFIPVENTPLERHELISKEEVLKITAVSRIVDKKANVLVSTSFETLDKSARKEALLAGANSLMINVTPPSYRALYRIYDRRDDAYKAENEIKDVTDLLFSLGRAPIDLGI